MRTIIQDSPAVIASQYKNVIKAFKNRFDAQNGYILAYRTGHNPNVEPKFEDSPKTIGDGLRTTGWCVSASQALLYDNSFQLMLQHRGAKAKLVSIDIKEQYYGKVYNGKFNKWHTAILLEDSGINLIIDITCGQFGNAFASERTEIWDFQTWEKTFRNANDKHIITDFENKELRFLPVINGKKTKLDFMDVIASMSDITSITHNEKEFLGDFITNRYHLLNNKLLTGNINKIDYKYIDKLNSIIKNLYYTKKDVCYHVIEFSNKEESLRFIKNLNDNDFILPMMILASESIVQSCTFNNIDSSAVNIESLKDKQYIVFEFKNPMSFSIDSIDNLSMIIPYGIKLSLNIKEDIYNGGKLTTEPETNKTNTIYISAKI